VQWCQANNKPVPQFTLYPRFKGFIATVKSLRHTRHVKAVYDVTIAYAHGYQFMSPPSILETLYNPNLDQSWRMHAHVTRYDLSTLPDSDEDLSKWLETRWMEKNKKLEDLRARLVRGEDWNDDSNHGKHD